MSESKFFLKDFFKNYNSKEKSIDVLWADIEKKVKRHEDKIKENIKKIGEFDNPVWKPQNLKDIYNNYQSYREENKTVKEMPNKELKDLLLILFPNPNAGVEKGLYDNPDQFEDFLDTLIQKNKQVALRRLISELLCRYPEDRNLLFQRLNKIHSSLDKRKNSNKILFEANNRFCLLEKSGPHNIAQHILDIKSDLNTLLPDLWIKERHLLQGIGEEIVKELCQLIRRSIETQAERPFHQMDEKKLKKFLEYLPIDSRAQARGDPHASHTFKNTQTEIMIMTSPSYSLRGVGKKKLIVQTLLNPFEHKEPEKSIKTAITQFLDRHIGDPRFFSEKWIDMEEEKNIFLRWKIGETIKDFLELLSYTAEKDPDADRMWPYRKEFIEAYWEAGHITEAWIVLGREAYKVRSKFLDEQSDNYGRIIQGANSLHSALIYKIGALIVSEWNYSGKVRVWNQSENAPDFYKKEYTREDLIKNPDKEITHSHAKSYSWQKKLSYHIEAYTGIPCPEKLR